MTSYVCSKHGDIGDDVLDTGALFDSIHFPAMRGDRLSDAAYPKQKFICARCVKQLIDDQFAPVRVKG